MTRPQDAGCSVQSASDLLESAYRAGMAAVLNGGYHRMGMPGGGFHCGRGGFQRTGFQRGGMQQRMGSQRGGTQQRMGFQRIQRPIPGIESPGFQRQPTSLRNASQKTNFQRRIPGVKAMRPMPPRKDLSCIQITVPSEGIGKPPLRDRLGWYSWQQLTPAQQVARNKLSLAKMRLNGQHRPQGFMSKAFAAGMLRGRQDRINSSLWHIQGQRMQAPDWSNLEPGVSPLLRKNVARLPGSSGPGCSQSVKSFSALSQRSIRSNSRRNKNRQANLDYLAERQFEDNASVSMSTAALQERMIPKGPWGSFNRPGVHNPVLDQRLQGEIATLQQAATKTSHELQEDFEYSAMVSATQTTSSDRFSLMMTLQTPPKPLGYDQTLT